MRILPKIFNLVYVLSYIILVLFFKGCASTYEKYTRSNEQKDVFVDAYELLDRGEHEKSFSLLKHCVHYDIRCLTLSGVFYYLGLVPVDRDVCNALYIWKVSADYGSADAQFYLGVMYSNYFSLPNLYSYYYNEEAENKSTMTNKITNKLILYRIINFLNAKYLKRELLIKFQINKKKHKKDKAKTFRNIPIITFNTNNKLIIKIKNIRYNIEELDEYFNKLNNFPMKDYYELDKNKNENIYYRLNHNLSLLYYYSSSLANHPGGNLALGVRYMHGYGVEKNCETACRYYFKITNETINMNKKTEFEIINFIKFNMPYFDGYTTNNKKIKNIEIFLETSLNENHRILTMIARRYLIGLYGVEKNYKKAHEYLLKSAKHNNSESISLLGYIYLLGLGVKKDYTKATEYFILGNKLNDSLSLNGLGYMHFLGLGKFKKNPYLAFYYFELAAKNNLSAAQLNLACLYLTGVGVTQSYQTAFYWLYKSLNNGNLLAAYVLGYMHYNGIITNRNCKLALSLLSKVAEHNLFVINTTNKIIKYTEKGRNAEAQFLMVLLAETGNVQSQISLSKQMHNHNFFFFLPINNKSKKIYASRYLAMASENNDFKSLYTLGDYAYNGYGLNVTVVPKNNLPMNYEYDINDSEYLFKKMSIDKHNTFVSNTKSPSVFDDGSSGNTLKKNREMEDVSTTSNMSKRISKNNSICHKTNATNESGSKTICIKNEEKTLVNTNKIISTDFIDEEGIIFSNTWKFNYSFKFIFNEVDYQLAYHHYKSIISHYPNNLHVIQVIAKACYKLGLMYYYGIGVSKNIQKALIYFNTAIKVYPSYKVPSVLFVLYIKFHRYLFFFKTKVKKMKKFFSFLS
uniref:Ubiquitin-protein ligase n=1 Tax=Piliocolobus tephrosceles TaxID=591936 RepID=A0A8C9H5P4_9PRIM